eukprot:CAMPEP_0170254530 /NCGR_PEP_ID=MMETSP0116_2-20130129/27112_1 /TAXON_ID=400756 /ORGANISM="Durinskia baltica, Strain CSIRO CS-38" /LENGTH=42 /DNA_ID= /DNA_START= /DNA_END= /DNA_ORIENTATION=
MGRKRRRQHGHGGRWAHRRESARPRAAQLDTAWWEEVGLQRH